MLGMHFFNPSSVMKLVEIITSEDTPQDTVNFLMDVVKDIGETPVKVRKVLGFIVNRILPR